MGQLHNASKLDYLKHPDFLSIQLHGNETSINLVCFLTKFLNQMDAKNPRIQCERNPLLHYKTIISMSILLSE